MEKVILHVPHNYSRFGTKYFKKKYYKNIFKFIFLDYKSSNLHIL